MPNQSDSIFSSLLNITAPWHVKKVQHSKAEGKVDIHIAMDQDALECPVCGRTASVRGENTAAITYLKLFQYTTILMIHLPKITGHNSDCRADQDGSVLNNTLLLDILLKMLDSSDILNPLQALFAAQQSTDA